MWAESANCSSFLALLRSRKRSHLLAADLEYFATPLPISIYPGPDLSHSNRSELLGAMYVIEGSTLGGQYIARHVEGVLGLRMGLGYSYFKGYNELTGVMWRDFMAVLEAVPSDHSAILVPAAKIVFKDFTEWMQHWRAD